MAAELPGFGTPVHVLHWPGDKRALCGLKDALPCVWARWVDEHVQGRGMAVCPACAVELEKLDVAGMRVKYP